MAEGVGTARASSPVRSTSIVQPQPNETAWNVTVRRLHVTGTQQAIILWTLPLGNITFDTVDITNAIRFAVRYESVGSTGIVFANITSTGSGEQGFYSSLGMAPAGVTFSNTVFY